MARQGMLLLNYLREPELPDDEAGAAAAAAAVPAGRRGDRRLVLLGAGRVLMLWGWCTLAAAVSRTGKKRRQPEAGGDAAHAFLGILLWLLGVSLVTFTPTARRRRRRFPRAARHGAAVTSLVMGCFLPPWN